MEKFDNMTGLDDAFKPTPEEQEGVRLENDGLTHRDDHDGMSDVPDELPPAAHSFSEEPKQELSRPLHRDDHDGMSDTPDFPRRNAA